MENGNCPTITLRKGKTEIKVQNAGAIIRRINDMYPANRTSYETWKRNRKTDEQVRWQEAAKNWFKQEVFGGLSDFEVVVGETEKPKEIQPTPEHPFPSTEFADPYVYQPPVSLPVTPPEPQVVQSVNKNAYEIRLDLLKEAIGWLNCHGGEAATTDQVLETAKKFYTFVEDRRR